MVLHPSQPTFKATVCQAPTHNSDNSCLVAKATLISQRRHPPRLQTFTAESHVGFRLNDCAKTKGFLSIGSLAVFFPQSPGCLNFVFQFEIDLVDADLGGRAGSKATIGIERDSLRVHVFEGHLNSLDDGVH